MRDLFITETERRVRPTCPEVDDAHDKVVGLVARLGDDEAREQILVELRRSHEIGKLARFALRVGWAKHVEELVERIETLERALDDSVKLLGLTAEQASCLRRW